METRTSVTFPPFRLELHSEQLWRDEHVIALRPKTFAVLRCLVEHAGQLVTKDALLDVVWAGTVVSDTVLKSCIRELRAALDDDVQAPQFIATVHRRGYRFLPAVTTAPPVVSAQLSVVSSDTAKSPLQSLATGNWQLPAPFVGRESELTYLHGWLEKALSGQRQLVFVTGEAGIGKTSVVEAFLSGVRSRKPASGQSARTKGAQYRPPTPDPWPLAGAGAVRGAVRGGGGVHADPGGAGTAVPRTRRRAPHCPAQSTRPDVALLARRREPARLLVLGTYRPVDVIVREHPLKAVKQELQLHGQCEELAVRLLSEEHIAAYLAVRVQVSSPARAGEGQGEGPSASVLAGLAHVIHQRTEGNPLFMVSVVDELLTQEKLDSAAAEASLPETIRQMIEQQLDRLNSEDQRVVEVASVAGVEFSAAAVAAGTKTTIDDVEQRCTALARRGQFLQTEGTVEWPDGTLTTRYSFLHALYQEVTYERVPLGRRNNLHQRIGEREETAYGKQAKEIAAELAMHFEKGRNYGKAVQYLEQAAQNAIRRNAYREAINLLTKGLEFLKLLPDTPERTDRELQLQVTLGEVLTTAKGWGAPEVEQAYTRARELCNQVDDRPERFWVLSGLWGFYLERAELETAKELATESLHLAERLQEPSLALWAHYLLGTTAFRVGDFIRAEEHLAYSLALSQRRTQLTSRSVQNPGVFWLCTSSLTLWCRGYPDQAVQKINEALIVAQAQVHPVNIALVLDIATVLHALRREVSEARERQASLMVLAVQQEGLLFLGSGTFWQGWTMANSGQGEGGIAQMYKGLTMYRTSGSELGVSGWLALLAEAYGKIDQFEEGLNIVAEALAIVNKTGERFYEAEIYRLKGELTLQQFQVSGSKFQVKKGPRSKVQSPESKVENSKA